MLMVETIDGLSVSFSEALLKGYVLCVQVEAYVDGQHIKTYIAPEIERKGDYYGISIAYLPELKEPLFLAFEGNELSQVEKFFDKVRVEAERLDRIWKEEEERSKVREIERKKEEKRREEERFQAKFEEAKATGQNVFLWEYATDCNDPYAECDVDIIKEYVTPEGKIVQKRIHCY